jgi:hypothetical protein
MPRKSVPTRWSRQSAPGIHGSCSNTLSGEGDHHHAPPAIVESDRVNMIRAFTPFRYPPRAISRALNESSTTHAAPDFAESGREAVSICGDGGPAIPLPV